MAEKTETNPKGAGRPRNNKVYKGLTINGTEEELNALRALAKVENKTVSRYVLDKILKIESHDIDALAYLNLSKNMKNIRERVQSNAKIDLSVPKEWICSRCGKNLYGENYIYQNGNHSYCADCRRYIEGI